MTRPLILVLVMLSLGGCGIVETSGAVAVEAGAKAQEARDGLKTEARVREQLDAAAAQAADQRKAAEAAAQ